MNGFSFVAWLGTVFAIYLLIDRWLDLKDRKLDYEEKQYDSRNED